MKCINCEHLHESESIEGGEFKFFCDFLGIEIEEPETEGCDV